MNNTRILAIVGLPGSGKTQIRNYLQKKYKLENIYLGQPTFDYIKKAGWETTNENERIAREKLRKEYGMGAYAQLSLETIEEKLKDNKLILLESLYSWEEYEIIKEKYGDEFKVLTVLASPETRYNRLKNREKRPVADWETFKQRDFSQIKNLHQGGPIARADYFLINEGKFSSLYKKLNKIIKKVL